MVDDENTSRAPTERKHRPARSTRSTGGAPKAARRLASGKPRGSPRLSATGKGAEKVVIELTKAQVDHVIGAAGGGGVLTVLLPALRDPGWALTLEPEDRTYPQEMKDRRLSRSLLCGLFVLSCFPPDGSYLGVAEAARMLDMSTSTIFRYLATLLAAGLLERDPATRKYRLANAT